MDYNFMDVLKQIKKGDVYSYKNLCKIEKEKGKIIITNPYYIDLSTIHFKLIERKVEFQEVLKSDKKCKVDFKHLKEELENTKIPKYELYYYNFEDIMDYLETYLPSREFKLVILKGNWFLSDIEEDRYF